MSEGKGDPHGYLTAAGDRFRGFERVITLDEWRSYCIAKPATETFAAEVRAARAARAAFFADREFDRRLAELAESSDTDTAAWATEWRQFREAQRANADVDVVALRDRIMAVTRAPRALAAMGNVLGAAPDARGTGVAALGAILAEIQPWLTERAQRLEAITSSPVANNRIARSSRRYSAQELRATCDHQRRATAAGWAELAARTRAIGGTELSFEGSLAAALAWTSAASEFYKSAPAATWARRICARAGIDLESAGIDVRATEQPGGRAFDIALPHDVRFCGSFPPGYEGVRGYLHELGHALHMISIHQPRLPARMMPTDAGLSEGIGEVFARWAQDPDTIRAIAPGISDQALHEFERSVAAFEAVSVRQVCLHALLERKLAQGSVSDADFAALVADTFAVPYHGPPLWLLLPYLDAPFHVEDYVWAREVRETFISRLAGVGVASPEAMRFLRATLLAPGNTINARDWLERGPDLPAWRATEAAAARQAP